MLNLQEIASDEQPSTPYDDVTALRRYRDNGGDITDLIYLSLGETWNQVAPGLVEKLSSELPLHCHGYSLNTYGFPALHRTLRRYITADHDLAEIAELGTDYDVGVSQNGTRTAMFHFGRLLAENITGNAGSDPVLVTASPGWDYQGVYAALGFRTSRFTLSSATQYQPDPHEVSEHLRRARSETTGPVLLAINAQHNPTGANWSPSSVREIVRSALDLGVCLLIDDAYFAVHDPSVTPTNSLRILLEEIESVPAALRPRWLCVRSLGKQFHCNGWGIGAMTSAPDTLAELLTRLFPQHTFASSMPLQAAMAAWLDDPASERFLVQQRQDYAAKRAAVSNLMTEVLGYPVEEVFPGVCSAFVLMQAPPWYWKTKERRSQTYREHCLSQAGVLFGEADMTPPGRSRGRRQEAVRIYIAPPQPTLDQAIYRLRSNGLDWKGAGHST